MLYHLSLKNKTLYYNFKLKQRKFVRTTRRDNICETTFLEMKQKSQNKSNIMDETLIIDVNTLIVNLTHDFDIIN